MTVLKEFLPRMHECFGLNGRMNSVQAWTHLGVYFEDCNMPRHETTVNEPRGKTYMVIQSELQ